MATTTLAPAASTQGGGTLFRRTLRTDSGALLLLLVATILGLMVAYTRAPTFAVGVVGLNDPLQIRYRQHLQGFYDPEKLVGQTAESFRWTQERSTISAPGLGRGLWQTEITLGSPVPAGQPKQVRITAGDAAWQIQLRPEQRIYQLLTPSRGDMRVTIDSPTASYGNDPRALGVTFGGAMLEPGVVTAFPPALFLFHTILALVLGFLTLRLIGIRTWLALGVSIAALLLLVWGTVTSRGALGLYSVRLLALALVGFLFMAATRWALPRLFRLGGVEIGSGAFTALLTIIYGSYLVKAGGLLWPYFLSIDIEWHMEKTQRVLTGRLWELWNANSPFHQSVMPTDEWGANKPVIPYSPFYYIFSAIWAIFPWPLRLSAENFSAILDALRPAMIFFIVRKFGFRDRAGIVAALTYSLIPATFLLHAWGNTPTTNGMWWSLLATTLLVGSWEHLRTNRWAWIALTITLTLTMLFYAVTAVFTTLLIAGIVLGLIVTRQRRVAWPLLFSITTAVLLSIAIYYWQFVPAIVERTIPRLTGGIVESDTTLGGQQIIFADIIIKYVYLLDIYGMYLPLLLGIGGWWLGLRKLGARSLFSLLMTIWLLIAIMFWFVGLKVSMVDKQLFWLMPWMGIGAGIAVDRLLTQRRIVRWAVPLLIIGALYTGSDGLLLWTLRLRGYSIGEGYTSWYQVSCRSVYDRGTCVPE